MTAASHESTDLARTADAELPDNEAAFLLHSRMDIVAVLRDIARARTLVNVHFDGGQDSLLTPVLAVDSEAGELLFDVSGSHRLNRSLLQAHRLLFYTSQDNVKIRFATAAARQVSHQNKDAFAVRLPEAMLRLQRRDCFRVLAPVLDPIQCVVPVPADRVTRYVDTRVHDISQGGVSLIADPAVFPAEAGKRYANCRIVLPQHGNVVVTLETVFCCDHTLLNEREVARIGCKYVRPTMPALALIQRYMMQRERDGRTRN